MEPRPYCLIRAQKQNPFFLACSCHFSLQIRAATAIASRAAAATAAVALPSSLFLLLSATSGEPTTRDHHASLLPPPSRLVSSHHHAGPPREPPAAVSSRVRPPPRETTTRDPCRCLVSRPATLFRPVVPLSVSLQVFRRPSTTTRTLSFFCRNCRAAVFFKVNFERVFV